MTIQVVFLDIDDTLLDFDAYCREAMKNGFKKFGLGSCSEEMYRVFKSTNAALWRDIETGTLDFDTLQKIRWNRVFEKLSVHFDGILFEKYFRDCLYESVIPVEGAAELLTYLRSRYILCAASNGPFGQQMHRLKKSGMLSFFTHVFISGEMGCGKPEKAFFELAFQRLNENRPKPIRPQEALILGDSLTSDVEGGRKAGMHTIWFNRWNISQTSGTVPDHTVLSLSEVFDIL